MILRHADNSDPRSLSHRLRRRRARLFLQLVQEFNPPVRVLDVGGTAGFWRAAGPDVLRDIDLTLLNLSPSASDALPGVQAIQGDARDLSRFHEGEFDVCFSNSVIEHVGTFFDQQAMAREVARVAEAYFLQTPNRGFPLEAHFHVPFWQFLPVALRARLHRHLTLGWMKAQPDAILARAEVEQIRLLDRREMTFLFPDGDLIEERIWGFTKSFYAVRRRGSLRAS
jgi:2-polyprenyl-3-methyl-5-hydroxy-6-metoxy-1,4-benzoquinol methylase